MKRTILWIVSAIAVVAAIPAIALAPTPILPESLKWGGPPQIPELKATWVLGTEAAAGTYVLRVRLEKGGKIPVHTHPDERYSTVLSGTLYVGFGETFEEPSLVAVPTGGVYVAPAGVKHYLYAKDGDVEYQEGGIGPTATVIQR
jgi:quercetin dioxygenase-like cupin family protein